MILNKPIVGAPNRICFVVLLFSLMLFGVQTSNATPPKVVVVPLGGDDFAAKGQSCPTGHFLTGFDQRGSIICQSAENIDPPKILGASNTTSNAAVRFGVLTGAAAANAICKDSYPNQPSAHMCSADDMQKSIQLDNLDASARLSIRNVVFHTILHDFEGINASNSVVNSCAYLTQAIPNTVTGTTVQIFLNLQAGGPDSLNGDSVNFRSSQNCFTQRPLLCCSGL